MTKMTIFETTYHNCTLAVIIQDNQLVQHCAIDGHEHRFNCLTAAMFDKDYFKSDDPLRHEMFSIWDSWSGHLHLLSMRMQTLKELNLFAESFIDALEVFIQQEKSELLNAHATLHIN